MMMRRKQKVGSIRNLHEKNGGREVQEGKERGRRMKEEEKQRKMLKKKQ
jgi:hypothetical protein